MRAAPGWPAQAFAFLILVTVLVGCSSRVKVAIAHCEEMAREQQPRRVLEPGNDIGPSMQTCMRGEHYKFNVFKSTCPQGMNSEQRPECYGSVKN